ncbi:hypothetical protein ATANTOWER_023431 [Ataeniobius toweri]|uniref:Uncharacterized protein n=1 Tax=Ataeniobius toweri TaxID=208326 RepID=A0ABU7BAU5_9TELE|nr:hypothetical protein [Ataeniobius toweri]
MVILTHIPHTYSILPGPGAGCPYGVSGGGPLPSGGGDRQTQHLNLFRTPTPRPDPSPQLPPSSSRAGAMYKRGVYKEGSTWSKPARQPESPQNEIVPTPQ